MYQNIVIIIINVLLVVLIATLLFVKIIKDAGQSTHDNYKEKRAGEISRTPQPAYGVRNIESVCLNGVKYYILISHRGPYESSLTPALMSDGKPELCKKLYNREPQW